MSNILITGIAGFIGSNLAEELLKQGHTVTGIDNLHTGNIENLKGLDVEVIHDNCLNVQNYGLYPDEIYHLGMASSSPMYKQNPMLVGEAINGTIQIFELAKEAGCKVVFASSSSLYNGIKPPHREDATILVKDYYTEARYAIERIAELYNAMFGVPSVGLRFFSVYGPKETFKKQYANLVSQFLWGMQEGKAPLIYGDGSQTRDFINVKDLVRCLKLAMESDYQGILNAGTGVAHSFNDVILMLNRAMGTNLRPTYIEHAATNYVPHTLADVTKTERFLGFRAQISLEEGIASLLRQKENEIELINA